MKTAKDLKTAKEIPQYIFLSPSITAKGDKAVGKRSVNKGEKLIRDYTKQVAEAVRQECKNACLEKWDKDAIDDINLDEFIK